jgi:hypothetical protein
MELSSELTLSANTLPATQKEVRPSERKGGGRKLWRFKLAERIGGGGGVEPDPMPNCQKAASSFLILINCGD